MTQRTSRSGLSASALAAIAVLLVGCGSPLPTEPPATEQTSTIAQVPSPSASLTPSEAPIEVSPTPTIEPSPTDSVDPVGRAQLGAAEIAFFDKTHGLVVGAGGPSGTSGVIRRTNDGGRTWGRTIVLDSGPLVNVTVVAPRRAWAVASCGVDAPSGCVEGLFRSDDRGGTWVRITSTVVASPSFVDVNHGWGIRGEQGPVGPGGTPAQLSITRDGGRTWHTTKTGCSGRFGGTVAVTFVDRLHGWVGCNETYGAGAAAKGIAETIDGGGHWTVRSGTSGDLGSVGSISWSDYMFALAMRPNGTGVWLGARGIVARTGSAGRRWSYGSVGEWDADIGSGVSLVSDETWFLVMWLTEHQETALERSDDAGRHWRIVAPIGPP